MTSSTAAEEETTSSTFVVESPSALKSILKCTDFGSERTGATFLESDGSSDSSSFSIGGVDIEQGEDEEDGGQNAKDEEVIPPSTTTEDDADAAAGPQVVGEKPARLSSRSRQVSFGSLAEHSFTVIKGDPKFEMAFPMSLGVRIEEKEFSVDEYELTRQKHRRKNPNDMRTNFEERRLIILRSKKRLRRRNSIGNGEMTRLAKMAQFVRISTTSSSSSSANADKLPVQQLQSPRPKLKRRNSIGNGEMSRLAKMVQIVKNSVTSESSSSNSKKVEEEKKKPVVAAEPPAAEPPAEGAAPDSSTSSSPPKDEVSSGSGRPQLRRQNSIGNGEISRLSSKLPKDYKFKFSSSTSFSKEEQQEATNKENVGAGGRPQLKRQNSIGNGEISRLSKKLPSSSRKSMFKKLLSFSTSSSKSSTSKSSSSTSAASPGKE